MTLEQLGWDKGFADAFARILAEAAGQRILVPGRVVRQDRGFLRVALGDRSVLGRSAGRLEHAASAVDELPVIGDWVAVEEPEGEGHARILQVLPRRSALVRRAAGEHGREAQVIASNVDTVFVMAALDAEVNLRRVERMLALTRASGAAPVVLLTKSDLSADPEEASREVRAVSAGADVVVTSAVSGSGLDDLRGHLAPGKTAVLLGPSGVGKSRLANRLLGEARLAVGDVREDDRKGRHTTTHRELLMLESGALIIDGPGMREFGLWDADAGAASSFDDIQELAQGCRFADCQHENEPGCAVVAAAEAGALEPGRLESFRKLRAEAAHQLARTDPAARRAKKQRERELTKAAWEAVRGKRRK